MPHILFVGHDVAPSNAFALIAKAAREQGATTDEFLLKGKDEMSSGEKFGQAVARAGIALIGMSSPAKNAKLELDIAGEMMKAGKPIALFADTFGAWSREWFAPLRPYASMLFIASPNETQAAQKMFPDAIIKTFGNPMWDSYFLPASREEARARLGVEADDFVILVPGSKSIAINMSLLETVADALWRVDDRRVRVFFARHPGEPEKQRSFYDLLFEDPLFATTTAGRVTFLPAGMTSDEAVPGVDCVLDAGNSSVGLHALCRRICVINAPAALASSWVERECGGEEFTPGISGVTLAPQSLYELGFELSTLIDKPESRIRPEFMASRAQGECAQHIATALLQLAQQLQ